MMLTPLHNGLSVGLRLATILLLTGLSARAQQIGIPVGADLAEAGQPAEDSVVVRLVTFYPGSEPFEVFGHTDIRVTQGDADYYFNYGVFDFTSDGFVWRFVMGDAEYMCVAIPSAYARTGMEGRRMVEQELRLTQPQARRVRDYLVANALPGNNTYVYQYLGDNCSTRPRDIIEMALGDSLEYAVPGKAVTYRDIMSHYSRNYPWEQFGIDLVLGSGLDHQIDARERMFIPMLLMEAVDSARVTAGGKRLPLVRRTEVVVDASEQGTVLPPTPWYLSPLAAALLAALAAMLLSWRDWTRVSVSRWFDTLVYGVFGLAGVVVWFLVFFSVREATSPNLNAVWANPLLLLIAVCQWVGALRRLTLTLHGLNLAAVVLLALCWPFQAQVANVAFFPLMAVSVIRSASYLAVWRKSRGAAGQ